MKLEGITDADIERVVHRLKAGDYVGCSPAADMLRNQSFGFDDCTFYNTLGNHFGPGELFLALVTQCQKHGFPTAIPVNRCLQHEVQLTQSEKPEHNQKLLAALVWLWDTDNRTQTRIANLWQLRAEKDGDLFKTLLSERLRNYYTSPIGNWLWLMTTTFLGKPEELAKRTTLENWKWLRNHPAVLQNTREKIGPIEHATTPFTYFQSVGDIHRIIITLRIFPHLQSQLTAATKATFPRLEQAIKEAPKLTSKTAKAVLGWRCNKGPAWNCQTLGLSKEEAKAIAHADDTAGWPITNPRKERHGNLDIIWHTDRITLHNGDLIAVRLGYNRIITVTPPKQANREIAAQRTALISSLKNQDWTVFPLHHPLADGTRDYGTPNQITNAKIRQLLASTAAHTSTTAWAPLAEISKDFTIEKLEPETSELLKSTYRTVELILKTKLESGPVEINKGTLHALKTIYTEWLAPYGYNLEPTTFSLWL